MNAAVLPATLTPGPVPAWTSASPVRLSRAARLRRLAALAAEHDRELAEALAVVAASGVDLAVAAGWGQNWFQHERRLERDRLIRTAAAALPGSVHQKARGVEQMLRRGTSPAARRILELNNGRSIAWRQISRLLE
jgi:hypothetical protein